MTKYRIGINNARRKRRHRQLVGALCLTIMAGIAYTTYVLLTRPVDYTTQSPKNEVVSRPSVPPAINYGLPVRLKIPKISVNAPIAYMGLTKNGAMAVPTNINDIGWYKNGVLPGNKGSAVLAGHVDGIKGEPGVFAHLDKLQKDDTLQIVDSNNTVISFIVKDIKTYGQNEQPSEVFNAVDDAHLNLITCSGTWDGAQQRFLERLVVFAVKI